MNPVCVFAVAISCAVLALAEPVPAGGNRDGFGGQQNGQSSYSRQQQQPSGLPYGANTSHGRSARSPDPEGFGAGNGGSGGSGGSSASGGSSYSQPQKQQRGLPYGANPQFGSGNNGGVGGGSNGYN